MRAKVFLDIHSAYLGILAEVESQYEYVVSPRGKKIFEITNCMFEVTNPICEPIVTLDKDRNAKIAEYTKKELELYYSGTKDVQDFALASSFWSQIANPDGTINSAYGNLLWSDPSCKGGYGVLDGCGYTPWEWAKRSLVEDKDTRQAVIYFNQPKHAWVGNKDFPCTMYGIFSIRDNKLNLSIAMRSQDIVKGLVYDLPFFVSLMHTMKENLSHEYPDLKIGKYSHLSNSMHMYETDLKKVRRMLGLTELDH